VIGIAWILLLSAAAYGYVVVSSSATVSQASNETVTLNGAGATLAYPLLQSIITKYQQGNPGVAINYQPIGSEAGINEFTLKIVQFGATYPPMTPQQKAKAPSALHIPESVSAVAVSYNIPGVPQGLNLTGPVIAEIFLYNITKWDDPKIQTLNPHVALPDNTIITVHADDAGSTFVFTGFLNQTSDDWATHVGQSITPTWPGFGVGVPADAQVANLIRSDPNTIGYMEESYAIQSGLNAASIQNSAGNFVAPSEGTTKAAADQLRTQLPSGDADWEGVNLLNEPGSNAYPLVTFTYLLVYRELSIVPSMTSTKASVLADFLWYVVHDGQALGPPLDYVPLSQGIVAVDEQSIRSLTFNGHALLQ
jgi:phosphate transport system substrate-binding protein